MRTNLTFWAFLILIFNATAFIVSRLGVLDFAEQQEYWVFQQLQLAPLHTVLMTAANLFLVGLAIALYLLEKSQTKAELKRVEENHRESRRRYYRRRAARRHEEKRKLGKLSPA